MTARRDLLERAAQQHGVFTTAQAKELGLTSQHLLTLRRQRVTDRLDRGVWRVVGAPFTADSQAMAVVLRQGPDAVLARTSAGWLWEVPGHSLEPAEVVRPRDQHLRPAIRQHTSRCLDDTDVTIRRGIPVTTPVRTIFDLAAQQHHARTRRDLNSLMARGLVTLRSLDLALERLAARGRSGITVMRQLIDEVRDRGGPAGSNLELSVEDLLTAAGYRHIERQVEVHDEQGFIARVDFGDRRRLIAIEVDSDRFHGGLVDRLLDAEKTARMEAAGWIVVRVTEHEVWYDRPGLLDRLRRLLRATRHRVEDVDTARPERDLPAA